MKRYGLFSTLPRHAGVSFSVLMLAGCAVGPDFHRPSAPVTSYMQGGLPKSSGGRTGVSSALDGDQIFRPDADIPADWWRLFHYPELDQLLKRILARNPSLEAAKQSLYAAQQDKLASESALYPSVSGYFNPARFKTSRAYSNVPIANSWLYNMHTAQLNISYSPDLWGGIRRQVEAAAAEREAQKYQLEAAWLTLTSSAVDAAISYAMVREEIATTNTLISQQEAVLHSMEMQQKLGDVSLADLAQQQTLLAQTRATLPTLRQTLAALHDEIAALANDQPDQPTPEFELARFTLPAELPVSLPAQLINQRPDIRTSEAYYHVACAHVGVAIANRLPNVQLGFSPGFAAASIAQMAAPGYGQWQLAAMLSQPLFDGFELQHQETGARRRYDEAAAQYRSTIITAIEDVADSLNAVHNDSDMLIQTENAAQAAAKSASIALAQLRLGDVSRVAMLNAQQAELQAKLALAQAQGARLSDTVGLFQALGGGWWNRVDDPANAPKAGGKKRLQQKG
ncbi:efflux transporter outer membrane subunit [Acetobacter sp.]|jgi:NodT family efflux transporter outer membrane factor (OMF) lipoprotein|uniref:efflux transporter outer membrane subunit n=1 Tax=Acetobacter sp. TaxID=440 RepID=UPI0025BCB24A|nr:efflux transporter outer membrane subunit [Acetobacter sp.]MCH4089705.1 efflux transporter outer membrane subunit [Acetobacter sp.]MCI1298401.1 efflux transporter outer membrane subunit [Acetobacter sp.]MCI1316356.1 efflux transporter outer membrane subunit [Acetobacter sp.]